MIDEIRAELAHLRRDAVALHTKTDIAIHALLHLMGHHDMSNKDAFLAEVAKNATALAVNGDALLAVGRGVDTLIASHGDGEKAFAEALAKLQDEGTLIAGQGAAIAALGQKVNAALPLAEAASSEASSDVAASAPEPPAVPSTPALNVFGSPTA